MAAVTRTDARSYVYGTSTVVSQPTRCGRVGKTKARADRLDSTDGKASHAAAGEEFLQRLNPNVTTILGLTCASFPCTMLGTTWVREGSRSLVGFTCFLGELSAATRHVPRHGC